MYFRSLFRFLFKYLICRFLFITAQTKQFPMTHVRITMDFIVVMATSADLFMIEGSQFSRLTYNDQTENIAIL